MFMCLNSFDSRTLNWFEEQRQKMQGNRISQEQHHKPKFKIFNCSEIETLIGVLKLFVLGSQSVVFLVDQENNNTQ